MEKTEARVKWMNSQSQKEKQGATGILLKIAVARQEDPTSPDGWAACHPALHTVRMTSAYCEQAVFEAHRADVLT